MPFTWTLLLARKTLSDFHDLYGALLFFAMLIDIGFISAVWQLFVKN